MDIVTYHSNKKIIPIKGWVMGASEYNNEGKSRNKMRMT